MKLIISKAFFFTVNTQSSKLGYNAKIKETKKKKKGSHEVVLRFNPTLFT